MQTHTCARTHTCTHSSYSMYSTHNQRPLHTLAHHSGFTWKTCACVWRLCMSACCVYEAALWWWWWCRGYGDKLHCPVTSIWGELGLVCRVLLEVICCCISDGLEMGLEREFMPPITERSERVTLNASHAQNNCHGCLTHRNQWRAAVKEGGWKKCEPSAVSMHMVYLTAGHNSAA